jgi:plastocyanin
MNVRPIVCLLLASCVFASPAAAGVIRGTLYGSREAEKAAEPAPRPDASTASSSGGHAESLPQPRAQHGITDAVIYVEHIPDKVERKLSGHSWFSSRKTRDPRLVMSGMRFVPRVMAFTAGTNLEVQNLDGVYHSAFSVSTAKRFDLPRLEPGRIDTLSFQHAGVVTMHCEIHPDEIGYLVVAPNHAFARPDSVGDFVLPKLPDGQYTLHVWHPRLGELSRTVTLPRHGDLDLKLVF